MLWHDPRLQIRVVQELRGNNGLVPPDLWHQGKQVRWRWDSLIDIITEYSYLSLLCCDFSVGPKLFSILQGRRTLAFTHVLSPTLTVLQPATPSLKKVDYKVKHFRRFFKQNSVFDLFWRLSSLFARVKEAAGDQSRPQISQWVFQHRMSSLLFNMSWTGLCLFFHPFFLNQLFPWSQSWLWSCWRREEFAFGCRQTRCQLTAKSITSSTIMLSLRERSENKKENESSALCIHI